MSTTPTAKKKRAIMDATDHGHAWFARSAHRTSQGIIVYESCTCGAQRVMCGSTFIGTTTNQAREHAPET